MQIFKFWGRKGGGYNFLLTKPYKECSSNGDTSFEPLTALIGPPGGPPALRMRVKKKVKKKKKNRRLTATTSRMRSHAPCHRTDLGTCMVGQVMDVINRTKFCENRSCGFRATRPRKTAFPIDSVHRPYYSVGTTVPHCDKLHLKFTHVYS